MTSKYDLYASNKIGGDLTPAELRGFAVYNDPNERQLLRLPLQRRGTGRRVRLFTDYTYAAIGVPRNAEIPANRDPQYYDLGSAAGPITRCPPAREYCGMFKTPTLRNVAIRKVFFHNGQMKSLRDVHPLLQHARYRARSCGTPSWTASCRSSTICQRTIARNIDAQTPLDGRAPGSAAGDVGPRAARPRSLSQYADRRLCPAGPDGCTMSQRLLWPLLMCLSAACSRGAPSQQPAHTGTPVGDLESALQGFLATHGQLCLAKSAWPIVVTPDAFQAGTSDARQMPVLERLGLVESTPLTPDSRDEALEGTGEYSGRSYRLTPLGQRYYLQRPAPVHAADAEAPRDFCAGTVALDHIVRVEHDQAPHTAQVATVHYAYRFAAFPWMHDAAAQQVFPLVAQLDAQQATRTLSQRFALQAGGWVPLDIEE